MLPVLFWWALIIAVVYYTSKILLSLVRPLYWTRQSSSPDHTFRQTEPFLHVPTLPPATAHPPSRGCSGAAFLGSGFLVQASSTKKKQIYTTKSRSHNPKNMNDHLCFLTLQFSICPRPNATGPERLHPSLESRSCGILNLEGLVRV